MNAKKTIEDLLRFEHFSELSVSDCNRILILLRRLEGQIGDNIHGAYSVIQSKEYPEWQLKIWLKLYELFSDIALFRLFYFAFAPKLPSIGSLDHAEVAVEFYIPYLQRQVKDADLKQQTFDALNALYKNLKKIKT